MLKWSKGPSPVKPHSHEPGYISPSHFIKATQVGGAIMQSHFVVAWVNLNWSHMWETRSQLNPDKPGQFGLYLSPVSIQKKEGIGQSHCSHESKSSSTRNTKEPCFCENDPLEPRTGIKAFSIHRNFHVV
jgi:hypothetical protein